MVAPERGYLEDDYLSQDYLLGTFTNAVGMQVTPVRQKRIGMSVLMVIYNVTQPRFMWIFPSQGTPALAGNNWSSTSTAPGDFSPNNVNTDVEEQVWRSNGVLTATLTCNTGLAQGAAIDTFAMRNHNLTTSAIVQVQGSNDNFATVRYSFNLMVERTHAYWISPRFPTSLQQNVKWRIIVQDPTNSNGFLQIGAIRFGQARIFTKSDNYENPIGRGRKHFSDKFPTEGFTSSSTDRSIKQWIRLQFANMRRQNNNYRILDEMEEYCRTSLKVLVIPNPEYASRFAVYGKIKEPLPEHTHVSQSATEETIGLSYEWDESL